MFKKRMNETFQKGYFLHGNLSHNIKEHATKSTKIYFWMQKFWLFSFEAKIINENPNLKKTIY